MNMKIGVIGAGNIGGALAKRLVMAGHRVMLSYTREADKLDAMAKRFGASAGTPAEAVAFGEVIVMAMPWSAIEDALTAIGARSGALDGKIVWDCTNPLKADFSGLALGTTTSGGEFIAEQARGARVVKAIPAFAELLHSDDPTLAGTPASSFVCSDDDEAKAVVGALLQALPVQLVDAGPLGNARFVEPACFLLVRLAYGLGLGPRIGLSLRRG
jgi:8-hydroxy-5-deazaflavin:NADPH oxidoreductase